MSALLTVNLCHTTQHGAVLIIFPLNLQTITITRMLSDVTAEALRVKIDRKTAISLQRGHFDPKFQVQVVAHHQSFLHG